LVLLSQNAIVSSAPVVQGVDCAPLTALHVDCAMDGEVVSCPPFKIHPPGPIKPLDGQTPAMVTWRTNFNNARATFRADVLNNMLTIAATPSGQALIAAAQNGCTGDKKINIRLVDGNDVRSQCNGGGGDSQEAQSSTVEYNPQLPGIPAIAGPDDPALKPKYGAWGTIANKPTDVTLFHELVHAVDFCFGFLRESNVPRGQHDGVKMSELRCVGLDEFDDDDYKDNNAPLRIFSENTYRHDVGVAQRQWYNDPKELKAGPEKYSAIRKKFNKDRLAARKNAEDAQANTRLIYSQSVIDIHLPAVDEEESLESSVSNELELNANLKTKTKIMKKIHKSQQINIE